MNDYNDYQEENQKLREENQENPCDTCEFRPRKNYLKEFLIDPNAGGLSMSRLCMGIVVMIFIPIYFLFAYWKIPVPASIIVSSLASLATVYGLNSAFGAYGRYRGIYNVARNIERPLDTMTGANPPTMRSRSGRTHSPSTGNPVTEMEEGG